jgi:PIN domain nuclease of toxin-antitoxin system
VNYALDASAMIAFASAEPGGAMVEELLADRRNQCFAHAVNLCEVYYDACRRIGAEAASQLISDLAGSGVRFRSDMDSAFWQHAGRLKADARRISLADCFGLALSAALDAEFVTADRHEMEALLDKPGYRIRLIR